MKKNILSLLAIALSFVFSQSIMAQPPNDSCNAPITLTSSATCVYTASTVDGATDDNLPKPSCDGYSGSYAGEGVWFQFTPQYASNIIKVDGSTSIDPVLVVYTGTCGSLIEFDCNDTSGNSHATISNSNFVVGDTYLIRVYDYGSVGPQDGSFNICIQHNASGGTVDLEYVDHITLDGISGNGTGDADRFGEPGEQIVLAVSLSNNGNTTAHNVSATLSSGDSDINVTSATVNWPDIGSGATEMATGLGFTISAAAIEKDVILNLAITSDEGTFSESFMFHIYDGNLSLHQNDMLIRDGNGGGSGNSNGQLDSGENISLEVKVHNSGTSTAHNVSSAISTLDSDVTVTTSNIAIGDISGGSDAWAQSFVFDISSSCPDKDVVFTITNTSDEGTWIDTVIMHIAHTVAVATINMDAVRIYPNPAKQYLHIENNTGTGIATFEIYTINGRLITKESNTNIINVSSLQTGLYLLRITDTDGKIGRYKFIKN